MADKLPRKPQGGRPATGSIVWADPATKTEPVGVRVTLVSGRRKIVPFDPGTTPEEAIALTPVIATRARLTGDETTRETVAEYAARWCKWRESRGVASVGEDRARLARHVLPHIGQLEVVSVGVDELKRLVAVLDANLRRGFTEGVRGQKPFHWKT